MTNWKVPIESLIDHIKTAIDVDPWAKEMAEELLKEQEAVEPTVSGTEEHDGHGSWWYQCGKCKMPIDHGDKFCRHCGKAVKWND